MPFNMGGEIGSAALTSSFRVDPDKVLPLKAELQPIHDEVSDFLNFTAQSMTMKPLGADPVSVDTAQAFNENIQSAIEAAWGYLDQLDGVLGALDQAVKTYNFVEDTQVQAFQRGVQ